MGKDGVKYDREIILAAKDTKIVMNQSKHFPMGRLRQALNGNFLTVTTTAPQLLRAKNLPESIIIDLDEDPNTIGPAVEGYHPEWSVKRDNHFGN